MIFYQTNNTLISIIIPVFNAKNTLKSTLDSALAQTYTNIEIIVVDDGSNISPEPIINQYKEERIRYYKTGHGNANTARNYGISKSRGQYIAMLDADDQWLKNHLEDCLNVLETTDADGLYGSLYLSKGEFDLSDQNQTFFARNLNEGESMIDYLLINGYGAQTSTLFMSAKSAKDIMWNPNLLDHQDYDFVVRFEKKYKITHKKNPTVCYYLASGRKPHYDSCISFTEENIGDINPVVYNKYNLDMFLRTVNADNTKKYVDYFRKEATRYKEYLSYHVYISIRDPHNKIQELLYKITFLFYICKVWLNLKDQ